IGFYQGGLARYRHGRFTRFTAADGVPPSMIRALHRDPAGRLWIAFYRDGVRRLDHPEAERPHFIPYTTAHGLSSDRTLSLTGDRDGHIYIGTGRGIDRLDPETGHIKHYTVADGLALGDQNVAYGDRHGALWFGTLLGLSRLIPGRDQPTPPPPILIRGLRIAGVSH